MNIYFILAISFGLITITSAEDLRLVDLPPEEAQQHIESKDQTLKYAPKIESNVPAVRVLTDTPTNVLEDIYLANQYHGQDGLGGYLYGYSVPDIAKTEKKKPGGDLKGAYQYINDGGQEIKVEYWDDGTGFHQVDNLAEVLPKQVEDAPDVQAAKEEHFRRWHEEAERNSKPVSPETQPSQQQYQGGQYNTQPGQQYQSQSIHQIGTTQQNPNPYQSSGSYSGQSQPAHAGQNLPGHVQSTQGQYQKQPGQNIYQLNEHQSSQGQYQAGQGQNQPGSFQTGPDQNQPYQNNPGQNQYQSNQYQGTQLQGAPSTYVPNEVKGSQIPHYEYGHGQNQNIQSSYESSPSDSNLGILRPAPSQSQYQQVQGSQGQYSNQPDTTTQQFGASHGQSGTAGYIPGQSQQQSNQVHGSQGQYSVQPSTAEQQFGASHGQSNTAGYIPGQSQQQSPERHQGDYTSQQGQYQVGQTQPGSVGQTSLGQYPNGQGASHSGQGYGHTSYTDGDYSGQPSDQHTYTQNQSNNEWEYKEKIEENGPPRGFFYNFDYPVGIIVQKQGAAGAVHKRESLEHLYTQNKANFEHQLQNGGSADGLSQSSYQVQL